MMVMTGTADDHRDHGDRDWQDFARYEPVPSLLAGGTQADLGLEARRLSLLVRAERDRRAISARRAEGWVPVDELFAADEVRQVNGSRAPYKDYEADAGKYREASAEFRARRGPKLRDAG
jgi:hypothetical protein